MSDIEKKALELVNEVARERGSTHDSELLDRAFAENEALCRSIEAHEAFRQEVSDAVADTLDYIDYNSTGFTHAVGERLNRFIITKPDPLVDALNEVMPDVDVNGYSKVDADQLRKALASRGLEIVEFGG